MGRPKTDHTGERFGRLVVVTGAESAYYGDTRWTCRCDCGKYVTVDTQALLGGRTKSCGCLRSEMARARAKAHSPDLTGQRFGRLVVLRRERLHAATWRNGSTWLCQCDCGAQSIVRRYSLVSGKTRSCGCLHSEITSRIRRKEAADA